MNVQGSTLTLVKWDKWIFEGSS